MTKKTLSKVSSGKAYFGLCLTLLFAICGISNAQSLQWASDQSQTQSRIEPNMGQVSDLQGNGAPDVLYIYKAPGMNVAFRKDGWSFDVSTKEYKPRALSPSQKKTLADKPIKFKTSNDSMDVITHVHTIGVKAENANPSVSFSQNGKAGYYSNYFLAHTGLKGVTQVYGYNELTYKNLWPGIDIVWKANREGSLKYDIILHPGADLSKVILKYDGAKDLILNAGTITSYLSLPGAASNLTLQESIPKSYIQESGSPVEVIYAQKDGSTFGFTTSSPINGTLVIDPHIIWGTYYGGSGDEGFRDITTDANGIILACGFSSSTTGVSSGTGIHQSTNGGVGDGLIVRLTSTGSRTWATYYGGTLGESLNSIHAGNTSTFHVGGVTFSSNGIAYGAGVYQSSKPSNTPGFADDGVVACFNTNNGSIVFGTFYGGELGDEVYDVYATSTKLIVCGYTSSTSNIATASTYQTSLSGGIDGFVSIFNSSTGALTSGTYLGGTGTDYLTSVSSPSNTTIYIGGTTFNNGLASLGNFQTTLAGSSDGILATLPSSLATLNLTYVGGPSDDVLMDVQVNANGIFFGGYTGSSTGIAGGSVIHQSVYGTNTDGYFGRFTDLATRVWVSYYGGSASDYIFAIAIPTGTTPPFLYLSGSAINATSGTGGLASPASTGVHQPNPKSSLEGFLAKIKISAPRVWGTYYGGSKNDQIFGMTLLNDRPLVCGYTESDSSIAFGTGIAQSTIGSASPRIDAFAALFDSVPSGILRVGFTLTQKNTCAGTPVIVMDTSSYSLSGPTLSYLWKFGDGTTSTLKNPGNKFYASAGTYTITLVVTASDGVRDSAKKTVTVIAGPKARFGNGRVCQTLDVTFTDSSTNPGGGALTYYFDYGNGSNPNTSSTFNSTYSYFTAGTFTVKFAVTALNGCTDTFRKVLTVLPVVRPKFNVIQRCEDSALTFTEVTPVLPPGTTITNRTWRFRTDNSVVTNVTTVNKKFNRAGFHTVTLIYTFNNGCMDSIIRVVTAYDKPRASFVNSTNCRDSAVFFASTSRITFGIITRWRWEWDDGSNPLSYDTSRATYRDTVTHQFNLAGTYNVRLIVTSSFGCSDTVFQAVVVNPSPKANFTVKNTCLDTAAQFTNTSTITSTSINAWKWTFGDSASGANNTSFLQNPTHKYSTPGTYRVRMIAFSSRGCRDSIDKNIVVYPLPDAFFGVSTGCQDSLTNFTDQSTITGGGTITGWRWNFGDGGTSMVQNPGHRYTAPGNYIVTLTALSSNGCGGTTKDTVTILPAPTSTFTFQNNCANSLTNFRSTSTVAAGTLISYEWNFGDGGQSFAQNPTHEYTDSGTYTVTHTTASSNGCSRTTSSQVYIKPGPLARFVFTPSCFNTPVQFTDSSTYALGQANITGYFWNFGDGTFSAVKDPLHTYAANGIYVVSHAVFTNNGCADTVQNTLVVEALPRVGFTIRNTCADSIVRFTDTGNATNATFFYRFGDGTTSTLRNPNYVFDSAGTFTVTQIVTSTAGCRDSQTQVLVIYPRPIAGYNVTPGCAGVNIAFTDTSQGATRYLWRFGDGLTDSVANPLHTYAAGGTFQVDQIVYTNFGCTDTFSRSLVVFPKPDADFFFFSPQGFCEGNVFSFTDQSRIVAGGTIVDLRWDFGDGSFDSGSVVTHTFQDSGTYNVTLSATSDNGCVGTLTTPIKVEPLPDLRIVVEGTCQNFPTTFYDSSTVNSGGISTRQWFFGDGGSATGQTVTHTYTDSGLFKVTLVVSTLAGCTDSLDQTIRINTLPIARFINTTVCEGTITEFFDSSTTSGSPLTERLWSFGDGTTSDEINPVHRFDSFGVYDVTLRVYNVDGCYDEITQSVNVLPKPMALFEANPNPAGSLNPKVEFFDFSTGGVTAWDWTFGDGFISSEQNPTHTFKDTGDYYVSLTVTGVNGCTDIFIDTIRINQDFTIYAPNVISLNGDGRNDSWLPKGVGIEVYEVIILNRWGQEVFTSKDPEQAWKGDTNGNGIRVQEGVYVYYIRLTDYNNEIVRSYRGNITVLR